MCKDNQLSTTLLQLLKGKIRLLVFVKSESHWSESNVMFQMVIMTFAHLKMMDLVFFKTNKKL